jgi:hypothetical protein
LVPAILEPLECQRSELAALAELIEKDRPQGTRQQRGEIQEARQRRLLRNQRMHAELAKALKRDEADALAMSRELQRKTADLAERGMRPSPASRQLPRLRYRAAGQREGGLRWLRCATAGAPAAERRFRTRAGG